MPETQPMEFRSVTISLGMWADAESFGLDQRAIATAALKAFPGAQVGIKDDTTYIHEVAEPTVRALGEDH